MKKDLGPIEASEISKCFHWGIRLELFMGIEAFLLQFCHSCVTNLQKWMTWILKKIIQCNIKRYVQSNKSGFSTTSNPITLLLLAARRGVRQCTLVCPLPVILSPQCDAIVSTRAVPPFPPVSQSGPSELRGEGRGPLSTPIFRLWNLPFYPISPRFCHMIFYQDDNKYHWQGKIWLRDPLITSPCQGIAIKRDV